MKKNNYIFIIIISVAVLLIGVFITSNKEGETALAQNVDCINSKMPLGQHIHSQLNIFVDGKAEAVPSGIGLKGDCEKVIHTHEPDGQIHIEANDRKTYTLGMFYGLWGEKIFRSGKTLNVFVDGLAFEGKPEDITFKDDKKIVLRYVSDPFSDFSPGN